MNLWKKMMTGALVSVMAVAVSAGWGSATASAEDVSISDTLLGVSDSSVKVDYETNTLTVNTSDKEVMVCVPAVTATTSDTTTTFTKITEKTYDIYQVSDGSCTIDLSTLSTKKVSYVLLKSTSKDVPLMVQFNAATQSLKGTYDLTTSTVSFSGKVDGTKVDSISYSTGEFSYRTVNSTDAEAYTTSVDLSIYQQTGATLYFRQNGGYDNSGWTTTETLNSSSTGEAAVPTKSGTTCFKVVASGRFASAEAKVKVTKRANGPSVSVDYNYRKVTVKKGQEYRYGNEIGTDNATSSDGWTPASGEALTVYLDDVADNGGLLEVRTSLTTKTVNGTETIKKQASKITRYVLETTQTAPTVSDKFEFTSATPTTASAIMVGIEDTPILSATVLASKNKYNGVTIKNSSTVSYDYIVVSAETSERNLLTSSTKYKTVKAGKTASIKATTETQYVYARLSGIKASKTYSSKYVLIGTVGAKE